MVFLEFDFLRYALIIGLMLGVVAPAAGVFVVVRKTPMIADAMSHTALTGIAFHLWLASFWVWLSEWNPLYTGILFTFIVSFIIEYLRRRFKTFQELSIPVVMASAIGLGVVFISLADGFNNDLFNFLFGSILTVNVTDTMVIGIISAVSLLLFLLFYKELLFLAFDEEQADANGIPVQRVNLLFAGIVAVVVASSISILGVLLVSALITLPAAAALRVASNFKSMFLYAIVFGEAAVLAGFFVSYYYDLSSGGTIAVISFAIWTIVVLAEKVAGRIRQRPWEAAKWTDKANQ
ncbi:metal ABC transporter permease [Marinococcus halophilus]|uniref:Zinc ABC transporter permease n=1 Tax=Marinococcus halophilus TaxID=1371 RepID=A0A510Y8I2_MARHA|nr:metal ABC transporter permease [Marinococcus halophilus]OZT81019.1 metal ABC transporter permease [Marinococcus halophilus]GEK58727.1 zinc ABC transporter permease [Marinococcus halophilus]